MKVVLNLIVYFACVFAAMGSSSDSSDSFDKQGANSIVLEQRRASKQNQEIKVEQTYTLNKEGVIEIAFPETIFSKNGNDVVSLCAIKISIDPQIADGFREKSERLKTALDSGSLTKALNLVDTMYSNVAADIVYNDRKDLLSTREKLNKLQVYLRLLSLKEAQVDLGESFYRLFGSSANICSKFIVFNKKPVSPENLYIAGLYIKLGSKKPEEYSCLDKYDPSNKHIIEEINRNGRVDFSDSTSWFAWGMKKAFDDRETFNLLPRILQNRFLQDRLKTP